jgi:redox-sensitive bicupin YhaK (pirin superfamily)
MLELIINARKTNLGGLEVGRVLPFRERRMVGPFVFFDHAGPVTMAPEVPRSADILPHPHIGLSTISYLFAGELMHRDSAGYEQLIRPGEVNWMTAGSGISHSERFEDEFHRAGGRLELIQAWVALPVEAEETAPSFQHHAQTTLPVFEENGFRARLIAGSAFGVAAPVKTHSPLFYMHVELAAGAVAVLPKEHPERAVYVADGQVEVAGQGFGPGQMLVFAPGAAPVIKAIAPATLMMLGGEGLGPRHIWWNFVSSSEERIEQAKADWKAGRIALPVHDDQAFIPLPDAGWPARKPAPEPLS